MARSKPAEARLQQDEGGHAVLNDPSDNLKQLRLAEAEEEFRKTQQHLKKVAAAVHAKRNPKKGLHS